MRPLRKEFLKRRMNLGVSSCLCVLVVLVSQRAGLLLFQHRLQFRRV